MILRLRRNAILACVVMAVLAAIITRRVLPGVSRVLGGGLLIGISFVGITSGVEALGVEGPPAFTMLKVIGRYALLGFLAYVMIARLRLPPLGLIAGASSFAVAAAVETVSLLRKKH